MRTKSIVSFDLNGKIVPIWSCSLPSNFYDAADFVRERVDFVYDADDCHMVQEVLADTMCERYGKEDEYLVNVNYKDP